MGEVHSALESCRSSARPALRDLLCDATLVKKLSEALRANSVVSAFEMFRCWFDASGWTLLCEALTEKVGLHEMKIVSCRGLDLADLGKCKSLKRIYLTIPEEVNKNLEGLAVLVETVLDLEKVEVCNCHSIPLTSMRRLADASSGSGLRSVCFGCCSFERPEAVGLLFCATSLDHLSFSFCSLGDSGAAGIAAMLESNSSPPKLCLSNNDFSFAGGVAIAKSLRHNLSLKELDLSGNWNMGDVGISAIADALKFNSYLLSLKLTRCGLEPQGAAALAEALKLNSVLKKLDFDSNRLQKASLDAIGSALTVNKTLTALVMGKCDEDCSLFMEHLVNANGTLTAMFLFGEEAKVTYLNERNKSMHKRAKSATLEFILCCKERGASFLSKDLVVPIAKMIWATRADFVWFEQTKKARVSE